MRKLGQLSAVLFGVFGIFSAHAQGTVVFNNHVTEELVTHIYGPETSDPSLAITGNGSNDTPPGTTIYTGTPLGGTTTGRYAGQNFTAQIWALAGAGQPASALQAITTYTTTFRTQAVAAGSFIAVHPINDPGIPNTQDGVATLQLRVWDNDGGTLPDWSSAIAQGGLRGASPTFNVSNLGNIGNIGEPPPVPPNLDGLQSFNLYTPGAPGGFTPAAVPEPATLLLLGIGGACLGMVRRRKP